MRRGFLFSSDAIFAVIVAISLMAAFVAMQQGEKAKEKAFETLAQKARDTAIVEFYVPPEGETSDETPNAQYYYCENIVRYNPSNGAVQATPNVITKCEGFG